MSSLIPSGSASGTGSVILTVPTTNNNQTATLPDATGTVMVSGNMPAFYAYSATTTTLTANTDVKIVLDTKLFDTNNNFSTANSRFTPTVAGYYQVNGAIQVNYWNGTILTAEIFKNGSYCAVGNSAYPQTVGGVHSVVSTLVYMNGTTDYLELYGYQYAASSSNVVSAGQYSTFFNSALVRAA